MRLDRFLAHLQFGSRAEVKKMIKAKRVTVDQLVVRDPGFDVAAAAQVAVDGQAVSGALEVYYLLNKPAGVITATQDDTARTVLDLMAPADLRPGLFPVGRLDKDTTGLLLLTNDGALGHALLAPSRHVPKQYLVTMAAPLTPAMRTQLENGLTFAEFVSAPATVTAVANQPLQILLTIHEGKFHQVKRMLHAVGNEVVALKRVQMGPLQLPADLAAGQYRPLTAEELAALKRA